MSAVSNTFNAQPVSSGAFGTVCLGIHNGQDIAIKILHPEHRQSLSDLRDFQNEKQILDLAREHNVSHVVHSNPILLGNEWQKFAIVMTAIRVRDCFHLYVGKRSRNPGFTIEELISYLRQASEGLLWLENLGFMHRDIKPSNFLIDRTKRSITLIDFGCTAEIAKVEATDYVQTRAWRAPELVLQLPYNAKADVWSLGVSLLECYLGDCLFPIYLMKIAKDEVLVRDVAHLGYFAARCGKDEFDAFLKKYQLEKMNQYVLPKGVPHWREDWKLLPTSRGVTHEIRWRSCAELLGIAKSERQAAQSTGRGLIRAGRIKCKDQGGSSLS